MPRAGDVACYDWARASKLKFFRMMDRQCIYALSEDYPLALRDLEDPPALLMVEGEFDFNSRPVLGIVGTRDSSIMAESWMKRNLPEVMAKVLTVSGGARGIDELAHRLAVRDKQATAVILPSSIDRPYPADWKFRSTEVLAAGGCLISEYPLGTDIRRWHFEKRNRLIAALSDVVLIVEARRRSGTAITARHAASMGRTVAALPWFPSDPRGELCNDLLASGVGTIVRDSADLMTLLSRESVARSTRMLRALSAHSRALPLAAQL